MSDLQKIKVGDVGITQSRLNPMGKVFINDLTVEAKSIDGQMIDEDTEVIVNKIDWANIIVSINTNETI
jgi:membrane-bound ClpP family serine protease